MLVRLTDQLDRDAISLMLCHTHAYIQCHTVTHMHIHHVTQSHAYTLCHTYKLIYPIVTRTGALRMYTNVWHTVGRILSTKYLIVCVSRGCGGRKEWFEGVVAIGGGSMGGCRQITDHPHATPNTPRSHPFFPPNLSLYQIWIRFCIYLIIIYVCYPTS